MPRGGARPGAGRPTASTTKFKKTAAPVDLAEALAPAAEPPPGDFPEGDENDPDYLLGLVQRGFPRLPDGRPITREMVWAAKERLNYHKPKRATTNERPDATKALPELTDAELKQIIHDEIAARTGSHRTAGAPGGAAGLPNVVRAGAAPHAPEAGKASQAALLEIAAGRDG